MTDPRACLRRHRSAAAAFVFALAACAAPADAPPPDPARPHHTAHGFRNTTIGAIDKPLTDLLRWKVEAARAGWPAAARTPTPVVAPDLAALRSPAAQPSVTWIGHATTLVRAGGLDVLTDPVFSERASPVTFAGPKRAQPPGVALDQLPAIDVVIVSHNHYDHLDRASVLALDRRANGRTLFLVPLGLKAWFTQQGIANCIELDWWDTHTVRGVRFQLVPAQHWSARSPFDRNETLWGAWAVRGPDLHWYFSGDTGYSRYFAQARERGGPFDLALLPVGAYEPRWFMREQHIDPAEAVQAHKDLRARRSIGIHWGTFQLTDEALDEPPRALARARAAAGVPDEEFGLLGIGETAVLEKRQ